MKSFSIVGRRYSASSSRRFSPFFSDRFERRGLVYVGADYSNLWIHDESYQYDLNGNRELVTNANGDLVVYSTGLNNELNSDGNYSYTYDAEGNRISKTNAAGTERELYEWDYRNRLSSVTKQGYNSTTQDWEDVQIVEYAYDYNNVLIRKVLDVNGDGVSDSKTIFLPENYQTAVQLDDADLSDLTDATVSHRYLWTPQNQDKLLADVTPTETLWTLTDHLGTIRDIIQNTPSGLVVPAHVIYDAYGNVLSCKDANGTDVSSPVLFGFTGKYFDADTQLQNNVNRWYDATTGRWLSTDPIGFNGNDTNLYRYVGNKILHYQDFYGTVDHHPYPLYLGGPCEQVCIDVLPENHRLIHNYLIRKFGTAEAARAAWKNLTPIEQRLNIIMSLRQGNVPYDQVWEYISELDNNVMKAADPGTKVTRKYITKATRCKCIGIASKTMAFLSSVPFMVATDILTNADTAYAKEICNNWRCQDPNCDHYIVDSHCKVTIETYNVYYMKKDGMFWNEYVKVYESTPEFASIDMGVMSAQECLQFENHIIEKLTFSEYYIEKHTIVSCSFGSYGP